MYEGFIYVITNSVNGKQYVGQTIRTINKRWGDHLRKQKYNKDNQYLYTAMHKYGKDNFSIKQIEKIECKAKDELLNTLNQKEIYYIDFYNTRKPNGYNMTDGGVLMPNTFPQKSVCNYDLERNLVHEFESISEAARYYDISESDISFCCHRKKLKIVNGYIWRFKGDDYDVKTIKLNTRVVLQYNLSGNLLHKYNGVQDAEKSTGLHNIGGCCTGKYYTVGGYVWRFLGDDFNKYKVSEQYTIDMYDIEKNFIKSFKSAKEASKETKIPASNITKSCKIDNYTAGGYFWIKSTDDISKKHLSNRSKRFLYYKNDKIYKYDLQENLLKIYSNICIASEETGYTITRILDNCTGKYKICDRKYIFKFEKDIKKSA